jgi:hypothetical protein
MLRLLYHNSGVAQPQSGTHERTLRSHAGALRCARSDVVAAYRPPAASTRSFRDITTRAGG